MQDHSFPAYPVQTLERTEVIEYLIDLQKKGWDIYGGENNSFIIQLDDYSHLRIFPIAHGFHIAHKNSIGRSLVGSLPTSMTQFQEGLRQFLGEGIGPASTRTRTHKAEPASNYGRISKLIGASKVEAVLIRT